MANLQQRAAAANRKHNRWSESAHPRGGHGHWIAKSRKARRSATARAARTVGAVAAAYVVGRGGWQQLKRLRPPPPRRGIRLGPIP